MADGLLHCPGVETSPVRMGDIERLMARSTFLAQVIVIGSALAAALPVEGQATKYWDRGGGNNNWSTAANWQPDGVPAAGDTVILDRTYYNPAAAYSVTVNVDTASLAGLTLTANGNGMAITLNVTVGGNNLNLNSGTAHLTIGSSCTVNFSQDSTISGNIQVDGTLNVDGGLVTVSGNLTLGAAGVFGMAGGGGGATLRIGGNYTNTAGAAAINLSNGTVSFTGDGQIQGPAVADPLAAGPGVGIGDKFWNLTVAASGKTTRLASHITAQRILTINGGTLDVKIGDPDRTIKLIRNGDSLNVTVGSTVNNVELYIDGPPGAANRRVQAVSDALHTLRIRWPNTAYFEFDFNLTAKKDLIIEADTIVYAARQSAAGIGNTTHVIGNDFVCGRTGACTFNATSPGSGNSNTMTFNGSFDNVGRIEGNTDPSFYNLNVSSSGKTTTLARDITVRNNFTINGGTYTTDGSDRWTKIQSSVATNPITVAAGSVIPAGTMSFESSSPDYTINAIGNTDQATQFYNLRLDPSVAGKKLILGQNLSLGGTLTVTANGVLDILPYNLTVNGNTTNAGTINVSTGLLDTNGLFSGAGGSVTYSGAGTLRLDGTGTGANAANLGTFTRAGSTVIYGNSASDQDVYNANYNNLTIDNGTRTAFAAFAINGTTLGATLTLSGGSTLDVNAAFDATSRTVTFGSSGRLILRGSVTSLGTFTAASGTVQYTADTTLTIPAVNYYNLEIGRSGAPANTVTIGSVSTTNLQNLLKITGGCTASVTGAFDATGRTVTFSGSGTLRLNGALTSLGTFTADTGTVDYAMASAEDVENVTYHSLSCTGGSTYTVSFAVTPTNLGNTLTIGGASTVDVNASFDATGRSVTFTGSGFLLLGGAVTSLGTFTKGTGTVTYDDTSADQTVAQVNYHHLTITKAGKIATMGAEINDTNLGGTLTLTTTSILTLTAGINTTRTVTCTGAGRININGGTTIDLGTFTAATSRVRFGNSAAGQTVPDEAAYYEIEIDNGGQVATIGWAVNDTEILAGGGITITGSSILDVNASFGFTRNLTFSGAGELRLGGAVTGFGTLTIGSSKIVYDDTAAAQTVLAVSYNNLKIAKGAQTATAGGSFSVSGTLEVTSGTFDAAGTTITVSGTTTVGGTLQIGAGTVDANGTFDATGGNVTFTGAGTLELSGAVTSLGTFSGGAASSTVLYNYTGADETVEPATYRNLTLNPGSARTLTAGTPITVQLVLTVSSGKFLMPAGSSLTVNGSAGNDLVVASGATLEMRGGASASTITMADATAISISGTFLSNTGPAYPTITTTTPGTTRYAFEVESGGLVTINGLVMTSPYTSSNRGLHLKPGASTSGLDIDNVTFNNPEGTGAFLNLELGTGGTNLNLSGHVFNGSPQFTVRTNATWLGGVVTMSSYTNGGTVTENDRDNGSVPNSDPTNTIKWLNASTWTGAAGTGWNTAGSWSNGVPDQDTDTTIPDAANDPVLDGTGGTCASLNITTGILTISSALTLTINGDFSNTGTLTMTDGTIKLAGSAGSTAATGASSFYNLEIAKSSGMGVTAGANFTVINNLTITSGFFDVDTRTITVGTTGTGNVTVTGTLKIGTGKLDVKGTFDASAGGTVTFTGAGRLELGGSVPTNGLGTLTAGTGTISYDGAGAQTVRSLGVTYNHLEIAKTGGSTATGEAAAVLAVNGNLRMVSGNLTAGVAIDINGSFVMESGAGTFNGATFVHTFAGNFTHDGGTFSGGTGSYTFDGTATQTIGGSVSTTFPSISVASGATVEVNTSGAGVTVTVSSDVTVTGTLRVAASRTLTVGGTVSGTGSVVIAGVGALLDSNGDFNLTGALSFTANGTLRLDGTVTSLSSTPFTATTGTIVFGGTSAQTVPTSGFTYYHLTIDKSSGTASSSGLATLRVDGSLTVQNGGTLSAGNSIDVEGALTVSGGTFNLGTQNLNLAGNLAHSAGTVTITGGTATLDGAAQTVGGAAATTFASLAVSGTGTKTVNGAVTVSGTLTVNSTLDVSGATLTADGATSINGTLNLQASGILDANGTFGSTGTVAFPGGGTLRLGGSVTGFGTFSGGTGTVVYDSSSDQTVLAVSYHHLQIAKGASTGSVGGGFSATGALTVTSGTLALTNHAVTFSGSVTVSATITIGSGALDSGGTFNATGGTVTFTGTGTLTLRGAVTSLGSFTSSAGCTVAYRQAGAGDQQVLVPSPSNYSNLTLDRSGQTSTTAGALTIGGNLTITAGTLNFAALGVTAAGNVTVGAAGTLRATGGTIHVDGTFDSSGTVDFSGGSATLELDGPVTSIGTLSGGSSLTIYQDTGSAQTLRPAAYANLRINAPGQTVTATGTSTVSGTFDVVAGSFTIPGGATVECTGAMTVTGTGALTLTGTATLKLATSLSIGTAATANGLLTTSISSGTPTITRISSGTFAFTVRNGGRVAINGLNLSYLNGDGLHILSDASSTCDVDNCAFSTVATTAATYSYVAFIVMRRTTGTFHFSDCSFTAVNPLASPAQYNIATPAAATVSIEALSATGAGSGASYEHDNEGGSVTPGQITWPVFVTWTGTTSTNWGTATNWSTGAVPTASDNVRIPDVTNDPTLNVNGTCKTLYISTGRLTIAANTLDVYGNITVDSAGALDMTGGTIALRGGDTQNINPGGVAAGDGRLQALVVNKTAGSAILAADVTVNSTLTLTAGTLDVATSTLTVSGAISGAGTLQISTGTLDADSSIDLTGGALTCTGAATLRAASTVTSLGTFTRGASTFHYDGGGAQTVLATVTYHNLTIAKTGGSTATVPDASTLNVANDLTLSTGSFDADAAPATATNTLAVTRDLVMVSGFGTFFARDGAVNIGRHFTANGGTFTSGASTFTFNGTSQNIDGSLNRTFNALTIATTSNVTIADGLTITIGGTFTNDGTLTFATGTTHLVDANGTYTGNGAVVFTTGGEIRLGGSASLANLTPGSGTVTFDSSGAQSVAPGLTFYRLTVNKSGGSLTISAAGTVTVTNTLTISDGTFDITSRTLSVTGSTSLSDATPPAAGSLAVSTGVADFDGSVTIASGATIVFSGAGRVDFGAAVTFPADPTVWLTPSTGTVRFDRTDADYAVNRNGATGYNHLTISSSGRTASASTAGTTTVAGNLTVTAGTFAVGAMTVNVSGGTTNSATVTIGTGTLDTAGTFDGSGGTITFTGAGILELSGTVTDLGTISATSGTVRYNSTGAQTVDNVSQYFHLDVSKSAGTATAGGALTVAGNLTVSGGGTFSVAGHTATVTGSVTVSGGSVLEMGTGGVAVTGTYNATGGSTTFTGAGLLTLRGTVTSLGTFTSASGCTVAYRSTTAGDQQVVVAAYHHLTIDRAAGLESTTAGAITLAGNLAITTGRLNLGANNLTVTGNVSVANGQRLAASTATIDVTGSFNANSTGEVQFGGAATLKLRGAVTSLGSFTAGTSAVEYLGTSSQTMAPVTYSSVTIGNAGGTTVTLSGTASASGTLTVTGGAARTFALASTADLRVDGAMSAGASTTLSLAGTATLRLGTSLSVSGTFSASGTDPNYPTVTWNGSTRFAFTLSGTVTVAGLRVSYTDADGMKIDGGAAVTGNVLDGVKFSNAASPGVWLNFRVTAAGTYTVQNCDFPSGLGAGQFNVRTPAGYANTVNMENSTGGSVGETKEDDRESGGTISPGSIVWFVVRTWTGTASTAWADAGNWTPSGIPTASEDVIIPNVTNDPVVADARTCRHLTIQASGILTLSSGGALTAEGNVSNSGSLSFAPGTSITLGGTAAQTFTPGGTMYLSIVVNKTAGTVTLAGNLTVSGALTVTQGTLDVNSRTATVGGTLSFGAAGTRAITVSTGTLAVNGTFDGTGGTTTFSGAGTLRLGGAVTTLSGYAPGSSGICTYADTAADRTILSFAYHRLQIDTGTRTATLAANTTPTGLVEVISGTLDLATYTLQADAGLTVLAGGTLKLAGAAAAFPTLKFPDAQTLSMQGTLLATTVNSSNRPVITSTASTSRFDFLVTGTATLNVKGLKISYAGYTGVGNGLDVADGATWTAFEQVEFTNAKSGGRHLTIARNSALSFGCTGCFFDSSFGAGKNVRVVDGNGGSDVVFHFDSVSDALNGTGRGEASDDDDDNAPENGVSDGGGAVIQWVIAAGKPVDGTVDVDPSGGAITVYPVAAFDLNDGSYYATYMVSRNVDGANNDRIYVLDQNGNFRNYSFDVPEANGNIVGAPFWYTLEVDSGSVGDEHILVFGTTSGYLYLLKDTGSALTAITGWPFKPAVAGDPDPGPYLNEVTSPINLDGNNIYFGGKDTAATAKLFAYAIGTRYRVFATATTSPVRTYLSIGGTPTRIFAGTDYDGGSGKAYVWSIRASDGVVISSNDDTKTHHLRGAASVVGGDLYIADYGGRVHKIDAYGATFSNLWSPPYYDSGAHGAIGSSPGPTSAGVFTMVYVTGGVAYLGDNDGHIYRLTSAGALDPAWATNPRQFESAAIYSTPLVTAGSLWIGNSNGKLYRINSGTGALERQWNFGSGVIVSDVASDNTNGRIMVVTSAEKIYYVPQ